MNSQPPTERLLWSALLVLWGSRVLIGSMVTIKVQRSWDGLVPFPVSILVGLILGVIGAWAFEGGLRFATRLSEKQRRALHDDD